MIEKKDCNIVNIKQIDLEVFDYYNDSKDINELIEFDRELFAEIAEKTNKKLYAFLRTEWEKGQADCDYNMWNSYSSTEGLDEEFKFVIDFDEPILDIARESKNKITTMGIVGIDLKKYTENYAFFNSASVSAYLLLCGDEELDRMVNSIEERSDRLANISRWEIPDWFFNDTIFASDCVVITTRDGEEFKQITIRYGEGSKIIDSII